jgi:hypothetical protein
LFTLDQSYNDGHSHLKLAGKWVCIGQDADGHMYVNLMNKGYYALAKRAHAWNRPLYDGDRLSAAATLL